MKVNCVSQSDFLLPLFFTHISVSHTLVSLFFLLNGLPVNVIDFDIRKSFFLLIRPLWLHIYEKKRSHDAFRTIGFEL